MKAVKLAASCGDVTDARCEGRRYVCRNTKNFKDNSELCRDGDTAQFACVSRHAMNVRSPHHLFNAVEVVTTAAPSGSDKVPTSLSDGTCC